MKHVLIIDPDSALRGIYVAALEKAGVSATAAASAQVGIRFCEEQLPDVILLELQLQGHSGVEFLHELRSYTEWQSIPVVLHTMVPWSDLSEFTSAFKVMGITGYAYKPETSLEKLVNLVEDTLLVRL